MRTSCTDAKSSHKLIELTHMHTMHTYNQNSVSKYDTQHTNKQLAESTYFQHSSQCLSISLTLPKLDKLVLIQSYCKHVCNHHFTFTIYLPISQFYGPITHLFMDEMIFNSNVLSSSMELWILGHRNSRLVILKNHCCFSRPILEVAGKLLHPDSFLSSASQCNILSFCC